MPPVPPDVARQQQAAIPPAQRFAAGFKGPQQAAPEDGTDPMNMDGAALADKLLTDAATSLAQAARAIMQVAPELVPILQKMLQAGAELQKGLKDLSQGSSNGQSGELAPNPQQDAGAQGGQVSMG